MVGVNELVLAALRGFVEKVQSGQFSLPESEEKPTMLYAFPSPEKQIETVEKGLTLPFGNLLQKMREQRRYTATELSCDLGIGAFISNHEARPDSRPKSNRYTIAIALAFGQRLLEMSRLPHEKIDLLVVDDETDDHQARKINFDELANKSKSVEDLLKDKDIARRKLLWRCIEPEEKFILDAESEWRTLSIEEKWKQVDFEDHGGTIKREVFTYLTGSSPECQGYRIGSRALRELIERQTINLLGSHAGSFDHSNEGDIVIYFFLHWGVYAFDIIDAYLDAQNLDVVLPLEDE
jgi:hypothetical protein